MTTQHSLNIQICQTADEAIEKGFVYREPEYQAGRILKCVVVQDGTESHLSSVDVVFMTPSGQKHVVMLTGALIKNLAAACR